MSMKRVTGPDGLPYLIDTPEEDGGQSSDWASPNFPSAMQGLGTSRLLPYPDTQATTPVRGLLLRAMAAGDDAGDATEQSPEIDNEGDTFSDREDNEGWEDSPGGGIDDTALSPAIQGYQASAYSGQSTGQKNQASKTGLLSQFTDTLARKEGNGFIAKALKDQKMACLSPWPILVARYMGV